MSLSDYTGESRLSDFILINKKEEVLLKLCESGANFTTELARECDVDALGLNRILYQLKKDGFICKIPLSQYDPCPQLRGRIPSLWGQGLYGSKITQLSWWTITLAGIEFIKEKFKGEHKPIRASLLIAYNIPFPKEEIEHNPLIEAITNKELEGILENVENESP